MQRKLNKLLFNLFLATLLCIFAGCGSDDASVSGNNNDGVTSGSEMSAFSFKAAVNNALDEDQSATIWKTAITVAVPYGTNRTRLRASFEHNGSSVTVDGTSQISGATANDFTDPVAYTVHGTDGTATYTVTVIEGDGLKVDSHIPGSDSNDVSIFSSLEIQFTEAILDDSLQRYDVKSDSIVLTSGDTQVYGATINDPATDKLVFVPYKLLEENTDYTVTISGKLVSTNLLGLGSDATFTFRTGSYQPSTTGNVRVFSNYESGYIRKDLDVTFSTEETGVEIQTGWSKDLSATEPDSWATGSVFDFGTVDTYGTVKVFARLLQSGSPVGDNYTFDYKLVDQFPRASKERRCEGIALDDETLVAEAVSISKICGGESECNPGDSDSLMGNAGEFTYTFNPAITNGKGPDFVVGENAFEVDNSDGLIFAELFYVEVSSNGTDFLRFDSVSLTANSDEYLSLDPGEVYGVGSLQVCMYSECYLQPYDLDWLRNKKEVLDGTVDISAITHVRYIDIPGTDYDDPEHGYYPLYDSFGNIIRDAYLTWGTGGADIVHPRVIHQVE